MLPGFTSELEMNMMYNNTTWSKFESTDLLGQTVTCRMAWQEDEQRRAITVSSDRRSRLDLARFLAVPVNWPIPILCVLELHCTSECIFSCFLFIHTVLSVAELYCRHRHLFCYTWMGYLEWHQVWNQPHRYQPVKLLTLALAGLKK